jgi:two-component system OmpR family response regulator
MLLEHVWDIHFDPQTSVVESHVSRLRAKLGGGCGDGATGGIATGYIRTVRGCGYMFVTRA